MHNGVHHERQVPVLGILRNKADTRHTQTNCGKKLRKALWIRHKTATPTAHAILAKSDHNKHPTQQHVPKAMIENYQK